VEEACLSLRGTLLYHTSAVGEREGPAIRGRRQGNRICPDLRAASVSDRSSSAGIGRSAAGIGSLTLAARYMRLPWGKLSRPEDLLDSPAPWVVNSCHASPAFRRQRLAKRNNAMNFSPFAQSTSLKSLSFGGGRAKVAALVATIGSFVGTAKQADAALISDINNDPQFVDRALSKFGKVGYLTGIRKSNGLRGYASLIFGNPTTAITTLHGAENFVPGTISVGTSLNYLQPQNGTVSSVISVIPMPGAVANDFNTPDVAILKLATPLAGVSDIQFGTVAPGQFVSLTGYGELITPDLGVLPRDGKARRSEANFVLNSLPVTGSPTYYFAADWQAQLDPNGLRGSNGDSGGEASNNGLSVGMMVFRTGNYVDTSGTTGIFKFSSPGFIPFYNSQVPEPTSACILTLATLLFLKRNHYCPVNHRG